MAFNHLTGIGIMPNGKQKKFETIEEYEDAYVDELALDSGIQELPEDW